MFNAIRRSYDWMGASIHSPYADYILCGLFYLEAIFFLPTDPVLIVYCLERRDKALTYATLATIGSVFGGISSYAFGAFLWDLIGESIIHNKWVNIVLTPSTFEYLKTQFHLHDWWAILIAGFTPVPYKAATLAGGFCKIRFVPFVLASIIARGARFYLLAIICKVFGQQIKDSVNKYFNIILLITFIIIAFTIWLFT